MNTSSMTARELADAPVFDGKSLEQRRGEIVVISIMGMPYDVWLGYMKRR